MGDVSIDWLHETISLRVNEPHNWQAAPGSLWSAAPGGAALLARMVRERVRRETGVSIMVHCPWWNENVATDLGALRMIPPDQALHSYARIEAFDRIARIPDAGKVKRVRRYDGYQGPSSIRESRQVANASGQTIQWRYPIDNGNEEQPRAGTWDTIFSVSRRVTIIIDDAGSEFRKSTATDELREAIKRHDAKPLVIAKISHPLNDTVLWDALASVAGRLEDLIVVITGDTLRASGCDVSRRLSWDRTLADVDSRFRDNGQATIGMLARCRHAVIVFGSDAAIVNSAAGSQPRRLTLVFDPSRAEGDFARLCLESMPGATTAFLATLAASVAAGNQPDQHAPIAAAATEGLARARLLMLFGFVPSGAKEPPAFALDFPVREIFNSDTTGSWRDTLAATFEIRKQHLREDFLSFASFEVQAAGLSEGRYFSILEAQSPEEETQRKWIDAIVRTGAPTAEANIPYAQIGDLRTFDPTEAESYRAIANVMTEYQRRIDGIDSPRRDIPRPISFAVFGPPGAGKSTGVTQIAREIFDESTERLTFNLAQFSSAEELPPVFHRIRDHFLRGRLPFVLFDEFDSATGGALGWLRHFLAPMQDGEFLEHGHVHPIGAAVFVFAGGTRESMEHFQTYGFEKVEERKHYYNETFRAAKGPDFVSRLRGHVDIKGINDTSIRSSEDRFWMIRRASALHATLLDLAPGLVVDRRVRDDAIDPPVFNALLRVRKYNHGIRSMRAVVEMSTLGGRRRFVTADLPSDDHLSLHVSSDFHDRLRDR
jgi:hypothetical protein